MILSHPKTGMFQAPPPPFSRGHTTLRPPPPLNSTLGPLNGLFRGRSTKPLARLALALGWAGLLASCQTGIVSAPAPRLEQEEARLVAGLLEQAERQRAQWDLTKKGGVNP